MNDKLKVGGVTYDQLGTVRVNNREYVFGLNNNDLEYFVKNASDNGVMYEVPNKDLTLAGNAGTSLTRLNERIVMSHIADNIKDDIRSRKLSSKNDITKAFMDIQKVFDDDPNTKKLLKGNVTDLDENKFAERSQNLLTYFDVKKKEKAKVDDDFDIVEGGVDKTFITDRTEANADLYEKLNEQLAEPLDPFANTTISPAFGMPTVNEPVTTEVPSHAEEITAVEPEVSTPVVDEVSEPTFIVDKLNEEPAPIENNKVDSFMGVSDEQLSNEVIDAILTKKKDQITPAQVEYLENLQEKRNKVVALEPVPEKVVEKPKQMVLTKPDKKAAYVDTVILCLITQLSIFGLLIFVLLLIK